MSTFENLSFSFDAFSGKARLFPLPNLVLFPHVMQPLHIFEMRYRRLLEDALAGDRLITMSLLTPGWETDYEGRPPLHPIACLARITTYHRLDDGTYNLLLLGLRRVRLVRELETPKLYREADVELCEDEYPVGEEPCCRHLQRQIRESVLRLLPMLPDAQEQVDQLLASDVPLGVLTDVISFMLDINICQKQALLAEMNVHRRAQLLLEHLSSAPQPISENDGTGKFPPLFSVN